MHAAPAAQKKMIIPQENQPVNANISKEKGENSKSRPHPDVHLLANIHNFIGLNCRNNCPDPPLAICISSRNTIRVFLNSKDAWLNLESQEYACPNSTINNA